MKRQTNSPCSKCGGDAPKFAYKHYLLSGKRKVWVSSYCIVCRREDQKMCYDKYRDKNLAYAKRWSILNKEKRNTINRKSYWKTKNKRIYGEYTISLDN